MRSKRKWIVLLLLMLVFFQGTERIDAAEKVTFEVMCPEKGKSGEDITVTIAAGENVKMTTMGLGLEYDADKLTYNECEWSQEILNNGENMVLVSDVGSGAKKTLNISLIASKGYTPQENILKIKFKVNKDYNERPVALNVKDVTDENMAAVPAGELTVVYGNESANEDSGSAEKPKEDNKIEEEKPANSSDKKLESGNDKEIYDKTFKTGAFDREKVLIAMAGTGGLLSLACYMILYRKRK